MRILEIRVYKHYFPKDKFDYSFKVGKNQKSLVFKTIGDLAKFAREYVSELRANKKSIDIIISINFSSGHDILCPPGLPPKRYFPLSGEDQREFWDEFTKS